MSSKDGGPAFPRPYSESGPQEWDEAQPGMSLRDWFAGQALAAFIISERDPNATDWDHGFWSCHAYRCADAMLKAREEL